MVEDRPVGAHRIRLLAIAGSTGRRSLSGQVAGLCLSRARELHPWIETVELDPAMQRMPVLDLELYRTGELLESVQVRQLRAECEAADAFVIVTPVLHGSFSGSLKNVLDHLPSDAFEGRPVFIAVQAGGLRGTQSARDHLHSVIRSLGGWSTPTSLVLENADHRSALSPELIGRIDEGMTELVTFCARRSRRLTVPASDDLPWPLDVTSHLSDRRKAIDLAR